MKKSKILVPVLTALMLTACGTTTNSNSGTTNSNSASKSSSSTNAQTTTSSSSSSKEFEYTSDLAGKFNKDTPVTITFWHTMNKGYQATLDEIIADFNKTELGKNITVKHEQIGGYDEVRENVIANIGVGATPNLAYCYPDHVALYRDSRAVEVLDSYISDTEYGFTEEERLAFVEGFYNEGKTFGDNKMYSLPFVKSTEVLFYDKNFFASEGLTVPTTWDEMWDVCAKIKAKYPQSTPLGYDSEANWFITNAEQRGYAYTSASTKVGNTDVGAKGHFRFNNSGNKAFLQELKDNFQKGYFTTKEISGNYTSDLYKNADAQKRAYMVIGSTGGAKNQLRSDSETGITTVPQAAAGKKVKDAAISQGPSICMFDKADTQQEIASWLFLKYITTNVDAQAKFAETSGYIPVSKIAQQSERYQTYLNGANGTTEKGITALSAKAAVAQSNMYFTSPTFVGSSFARDAVGTLIVDVLSKGADIDTALKAAVDSCVNKLA